jgi:hypothetical protein
MPDTTFEEFVRASLSVLGRYAYALTGDRQAGEDLVQDTLIKVSRSWRRVRSEGDHVRPSHRLPGSQLAGALTANTLRDVGGRYLLDGYGEDVGNVLLTSADGHRWQRISLG